MSALLRPAAAPRDEVLLAGLNPAQRDAVLHGRGASAADVAPLLVLAGAGTGKTRTLVARVARLVVEGADPNRLLLLTFSRRAAAELVRRAGDAIHAALALPATTAAPALPWAGTFHAVGARLLRAYAPRIGLAPDFTLVDRGDAEDLMGLVRQARGHAVEHRRFPLKGTCVAIHSRAINAGEPLEDVLARDYPWCAGWADELRALFAAYADEKLRQHLLDYDDLLLWWREMLAEPALAAEVAARFDHVLVDEYQDTNRLQADILAALKPAGGGLTVVGDDAQSIYGFRAAEVGNILGFEARFGSAQRPARRVTLTENYRSTQPVLDVANAVIARARHGYAKRLASQRPAGARPRLVHVADELEQARRVADTLLERREDGLPLKAQAVLFRKSASAAALELELARRNIPFLKFGGLQFLEAAHVKDVLAVLRLAQNPRGRIAGFRALQLVPGVGPGTARRVLDALAAAEDPAAALAAARVPPSARAAWDGFVALHGALVRGEAGWPGEIERVVRWFTPLLDGRYEQAAPRRADLAQLAQLAASYGSRERFLAELTLDPPAATSDEAGKPLQDEDYVILSTIHAAKGQEWTAVTLLNVVDGCIPACMGSGSDADIEEERRLLYVALTRAREYLDLMVPQRFYVSQQAADGDRHVYGGLSRFIGPEVEALLEPVGPGSVAFGDDIAEGGATVDLAARMRRLWR